MTKRERVLKAVRFEKTDFTPYEVGFTTPMLDKMIAYTGNPDYMRTIDNHICETVLTKPDVEIRPGYFKDEFGVVWNRSGADKDIGVVDAITIEEPDALDDYEFPPVDEQWVRAQMESLLRNRGERLSLGAIGFSMFERAWTLRGMENLLCDMMTEPDFVHALMEKIMKRNLEIVDIALEYEIDGFHFGDDWGQQRGLIMGPKCWREFIKPYMAEMYSHVRKKGLVISQHSCGDIRLILNDLYEMGLNIYQTFQPEIYGLSYAEKLFGKIAVWGGVSTQADLPRKTPEEIKQVTRALLDAFQRGGLIAAPTHAIPADVPPENVLAMLEVLKNQ